jgi:hypothetical protein
LNTDLITGTVSGWFDATAYKFATMQIMGSVGLVGATIAFEHTNDTTLAPTGGVLLCHNVSVSPSTLSIVSGPVNVAATSTTIYTAALTARYFRIRIFAAPSAGTLQASVTLSTQVIPPSVVTLAQSSNNIGNIPSITNVGTLATLSVITNLGISTLACTTARATAFSNAAVAVKGTAGRIHGLNITNQNAVPVYVKFYAAIVGAVTNSTITTATALPVRVFTVPANSVLLIEPQLLCLESLPTAITWRCCTSIADNNDTAPTTPLYAEVQYI